MRVFLILMILMILVIPELGRSASSKSSLFIRYDSQIDKQGFTSPVVDFRINGKDGLFLIDTGASINVIGDWFAAEAKLRTTETGEVDGSTGGSHAAGMIRADFGIKMTNRKTREFVQLRALVTSLPPEFSANKIAGILSPQSLLKNDSCLRLDFREPSFVVDDASSGVCHASRNLKVIGSKDSEPLFLVPLTVDRVPANLVLDSGAERLAIGSQTKVGSALLPRSNETSEKVSGINGEQHPVRLLPGAKVAFDSRQVNVDVRIQPTSKKMPGSGVLGMEYLRNCVTILSRTSGNLTCH